MHILWIRGHDKDIGNEMADKHAGEAADEEGENEVRWRPRDWGFSEFGKDFPVHFMAGKTAAKMIFEGEDISMDAPNRRQRLRDNKRKNNNEEIRQAEDQGRMEDQERSLKPNILEIQHAIADAAAKCGRPKKRMGSKLAKNHPAMIELMEAMTLRSMAAHPLARFDLNKRVCSCRIKVRTLEK